MQEKLKIVGVAIKTDDGNVFHLNRPNRHSDLISYIRNVVGYTGCIYGEDRQGFILNDGTFVNRIDSIPIAKESGQLKGPMINPFLASVDLW